MKWVICASYVFPEGDLIVLWQKDICSRSTEFGDGTLQPHQSFLHQPCAGDVVSMAVSVDCHGEKKALSTKCGLKIICIVRKTEKNYLYYSNLLLLAHRSSVNYVTLLLLSFITTVYNNTPCASGPLLLAQICWYVLNCCTLRQKRLLVF